MATKKALEVNLNERKSWLKNNDMFSIRKQCTLLDINRSSLYYQGVPISELNLTLMRLLDLHTPLCFDDALDFLSLKKMQPWKNMFAKKKEYYLEENCLALGFLLSQALAKQALEYLQDKIKEEYSVNDPMFYSLRLNVGLMSINNK